MSRPSRIWPTLRTRGDGAVMGDHHQGEATLAPDLIEQGDDLVARGVIEVSRRLVSEQHRRFLDECAGDRYPLLLTAGQLRWQVPHQLTARLTGKPVSRATKARLSPASPAVNDTARCPWPTWPSARSSTGRSDAVACCSAAHIL